MDTLREVNTPPERGDEVGGGLFFLWAAYFHSRGGRKRWPSSSSSSSTPPSPRCIFPPFPARPTMRVTIPLCDWWISIQSSCNIITWMLTYIQLSPSRPQGRNKPRLLHCVGFSKFKIVQKWGRALDDKTVAMARKDDLNMKDLR